jgi:hypothetical protein
LRCTQGAPEEAVVLDGITSICEFYIISHLTIELYRYGEIHGFQLWLSMQWNGKLWIESAYAPIVAFLQDVLLEERIDYEEVTYRQLALLVTWMHYGTRKCSFVTYIRHSAIDLKKRQPFQQQHQTFQQQ